VWAADGASVSRGLGAGLRYVNRAVERARTHGLLSLLPLALHRQAQELLWNSEFALALAAAQEGFRLSVDIGYGTVATWPTSPPSKPCGVTTGTRERTRSRR